MTSEGLQREVVETSAKRSAENAAKAKSLEMLYDYTKFHIGVYLTLTTAYIALAKITIKYPGTEGEVSLSIDTTFMTIAVLAFILAGASAGIIVSSITQQVGGSSVEFLKTRIGPWKGELIHLEGRTWTFIEHTSFWIGLIAAVVSIVLPEEFGLLAMLGN